MASMTGLTDSTVHAVIVVGPDILPDDLAVTYHRVGTECPPYGKRKL
jgi:hypothetical protein